MEKIAKFKVVLLTVLIMVLLMGGCNNEKKTFLLEIDNKKLYLEDFMYDIYMIEAEGNALDQYYRDNNFDYSNYWDLEYDGISMREAAKESILSRVIMYEILNDQAQKNNLTLSEQELSANIDSVDKIVTGATEAELKKRGLSRDILLKAYHKISLGDKYYQELAKDFNMDADAIKSSIKFDEYREYKTETLFIPTIASFDESGNGLPLSAEQLKNAYNIILETLEEVKDGADFKQTAENNNRLYYYSRNFVIGKTNYEQTYQDAAIELENDEISDIVSTNFGYYIIRMIDNNSLEQYEKAIQNAIKQEENNQFAVIYNNIRDQYNVTINEELWNKIKIGNMTVKSDK